MKKPTICIDFDGVIHAYSKGWTSVEDIYDEPVPGAKEAIRELRKDFRVVVLSTRLVGRFIDVRLAILEWLEKHDIEVDALSSDKVAAVAYIDDRAINFAGNWTSVLRDVAGFRPWTKGRLGVYLVGSVATVVAYDEKDAIEVLREDKAFAAEDLDYADDTNLVVKHDDDALLGFQDDTEHWLAPCWVLAKALGRCVLGTSEL
jgi:hypothetical protein